MACRCCGVDGPTKWVEFEQNIGLLVTRLRSKVEGDLCRVCMGRYFRSYTLTTLFLGWWGLISFFKTIVILFENVSEYFRARALPEPGFVTTNLPLGSPLPAVGSFSLTFKVIYGATIWAVVAAAIASHHVDSMEKHAPKLNAMLHGGEIKDETDIEYAWLQIGKDISAIHADTSSQKWEGLRTEMLSRESYLTDLNAQNDRIQNQIALERDQNLGKGDPCEQWVLDEWGPALKDYVAAINDAFSLVKNTPKATEDSNKTLQSLGSNEDNALKNLQQAFSDAKEKGCDK